MNASLPLLTCCALALGGAAVNARAQVVPATPGGFKVRQIGDAGASAGIASVQPPKETIYRQVTYIALSQPRQWKSADGKSLLGKLIAFEDIVVESKGAAPDKDAAPAMPPVITVVREGKARLLVNSKPFEVALERLGEDERRFVTGVNAAVKAKAARPDGKAK